MCALSYGGNKHGLNYNPRKGEEGKERGRKTQPWFASSARGGIFQMFARETVVALELEFIEKGPQ